jgi:predicted transcriptional regulator
MIDFREFVNGELLSPLEMRLIDLLVNKGPMTRDDMVRELNRSRTTIYDQLTRLIAHNLVKKYKYPQNMRGRPPVLFEIQPID